MHKNSSNNTQSRTDRHAVHGRQSDAGTDSTSFRNHPEPNVETDRARLVKDKGQIEQKLAQINAQLRSAKDAFHRNNAHQVGYDFTAKWESQRANLVRKLNGINNRLMELNYNRAMKVSDERGAVDDFPRFFLALAKEMLAEPVYNRIVVAAHHRQQEKRSERKVTP